MKALSIVSPASGSGKTLLTSALLYRLQNRVRPYKVGPDFIDTQFHKKLCGTDSVNLDSFMMTQEQMRDTFYRYAKEINIIEGAMGFYDGMDRGCSSYSLSKELNIPTVMVMDASGSYITISALLKGLREYKKPNPIKAVVLNRVSSESHFKRIVDILKYDHPDIFVAGWIKKGLKSISSTHLGLELDDMEVMNLIADDVLENIDIDGLLSISDIDIQNISLTSDIYRLGKKATIVYDENFSFLYYDNLVYLKETFDEVKTVSAVNDDEIDMDSDIVIICGGYVESDRAYSRVKNSKKFKDSLQKYVDIGGKIYAECAGLLYLSEAVDDKEMSAILPLRFNLNKRFVRLGYYQREDGIKGHAFHYTAPDKKSLSLGCKRLKKFSQDIGEYGEWRSEKGNIIGTYLHTFWRTNDIFTELLHKNL